MLRTPLNKSYLHRTYRPTYGWTQQTPDSVLLDPAWDRSVQIWPGMVAMKTGGDKVTLINATGVPHGFFGEYIGGDGIDEPLDRGVNATAVWVMGPDAEAEILAPAFLSSAFTTEPNDGTALVLHVLVDGVNRGKLVPAGTTGQGTVSARPVCRLRKVVSASKIVVSGLRPGDV